MKKLLLLCLIIFCFACESEGPEPEIESEVLEVTEEVSAAMGDSDEVFLVVEKMPEFEGGLDAWNNFLKNELKYPDQAQRMGIEGRVFVSFIVQPNGEITDIQPVRGIGGGCDEEALRVLKKSPYWTPGEQRGKKVATRMNVVISFKL